MTLSIFSIKTGQLVNSKRSKAFDSPWKYLQADKNFLCIPSKSHACFVKLRRRQIKRTFDREDMRGCMLHFAQDLRIVYFVSQADRTLLTGLYAADLSSKFQQELGNMRRIRFVSDSTLLGVCEDTAFENSTRLKNLVSNGVSENSWSIVKVDCELVQDAREFGESPAVAEVVRTDLEILQVRYSLSKLGAEVVAYILKNGQSFLVEFRSGAQNGQLELEIFRSRSLFETLSNQIRKKSTINVNFFSGSKNIKESLVYASRKTNSTPNLDIVTAQNSAYQVETQALDVLYLPRLTKGQSR